MINELSFGPHYPTLLNPLDKTISIADTNYYDYEYFLSIVPTIYSKSSSSLNAYIASLGKKKDKNLIFANQYAATSQSRPVPESINVIPGVFFKYDIEPIMLLISEERSSFIVLLIRLINVASGVIVTGGWLYQMYGWFVDSFLKRNRTGRSKMDGVLHGRHHSE